MCMQIDCLIQYSEMRKFINVINTSLTVYRVHMYSVSQNILCLYSGLVDNKQLSVIL